MNFWQWIGKAVFGIQPQLPKPVLVSEPTEKGKSVESIKGVDVSYYQAGIKWDEIAKAGNKFAFLKATDGMGKDAEFLNLRAGANAVGLITGCYHYFRFDVPPSDQMHNFLSLTGGFQKGELPLVIDVEWDKHSSRYGEGKVMDTHAADMVETAVLWLLDQTGHYPMIYTNFYFWFEGNAESTFKNCPLWVPNYHAKGIEEVKLPKPWERATFWQYSESLKMAGVEAIDGDYFLGTEDELRKLVKV